MAGDPLKRVQPGDTLEIRASTYNTVVDAVKGLQANRPGRQHQNQPALAQSGIVLIRNDSGVNRDRFDVLGIAGSIFGSSTPEFPNRIVLSGATPTADHGIGFVILQEPIAAGRIGRAVISGVTQARVNVENSGDTIAGLDADDPTRLTTSVPGTALILAVDSGAGTQWGIVNVGAALAHQARWIEFTTTEAFTTSDADVDVDGVVYHDGYEPSTAITTVYNKDTEGSGKAFHGADNHEGIAEYSPETDKYIISSIDNYNRCTAKLKGALASADATATTDNVSPVRGADPTASSGTELTVYNTHDWDGDDNADCRIEWNETAGHWELYQVDCPA